MRPAVTTELTAMERPRETDRGSPSERLRSRLAGVGGLETMMRETSRRRGSIANGSQLSLPSNVPTTGAGSQVGSPRVAKTGWNSKRPRVTFPTSHSTSSLHQTPNSPKPQPSRVSLRSAMKPSTRPPAPPAPPSDTVVGPSVASIPDSHEESPAPRPRGLSFRPPPKEQTPQTPQATSDRWDNRRPHPGQSSHRDNKTRTRRLSVRAQLPPAERRSFERDPHDSDSDFTDSNLSDDTHATTAESDITINEPKARHSERARPAAPTPPPRRIQSSRHHDHQPVSHHHAVVRTPANSGRAIDSRTVSSRTAPTSRSAKSAVNLAAGTEKSSASSGRRTVHIEVVQPPAPKQQAITAAALLESKEIARIREEESRRREEDNRRHEEDNRRHEEVTRRHEEETRRRERIETGLREQISRLEQQLQIEAEAREKDRLALAAPRKELDGALERVSVLNAEREKTARDLEQVARERDVEKGRGEELLHRFEAQAAQIEAQAKSLSDMKETLEQQSKLLEERCGSLSSTEKERDELLGQKAELEAKVGLLEQKIDDVRAARSQSEIVTIEKLAAAEMMREVLQIKVDGMETELVNKRMEIEDLTKARDELKEENEKLAASIIALTDEKKALEEERQKAEEKITALEEGAVKLRAAIDGLEGDRAGLELKVTGLEEEIQVLKTKAEEQEKAIGEKETQIGDISKERDCLKEEITSLTAAKEEKEKEVEAINQQLAATKDEKDREIDEMNQKLATAKEESEKEISEIKEKLAAAEAETTKVQDELKELQSRTPEDFDATVEALGKEKEELSQKITELQAEAEKVAALTTEKDELSQKVTDLQAEADKVSALSTEKDELSKKVTELQAEADKIPTLTTEKDELSQKISALQAEADRIPALATEKAELEAKKSELQQEADTIPLMREEAAALMAQLELVKQEAATEQTRLQLHVNSLRLRLATEGKSTRKKVASNGTNPKLSKKEKEDQMFFVRNSQDRGRMYVPQGLKLFLR